MFIDRAIKGSITANVTHPPPCTFSLSSCSLFSITRMFIFMRTLEKKVRSAVLTPTPAIRVNCCALTGSVLVKWALSQLQVSTERLTRAHRHLVSLFSSFNFSRVLTKFLCSPTVQCPQIVTLFVKNCLIYVLTFDSD